MKKIIASTLLVILGGFNMVNAQLPQHEQIHNNTVQIEHNKQSITYLSKQNTANKAEIKRLNTQIDNVSTQINKSTSTAIALASLEYPAYNKDKKLSVAVGTGTYKGHTSVAYGIAYRPNYDMIFSIKGSDDSVGASIGLNL